MGGAVSMVQTRLDGQTPMPVFTNCSEVAVALARRAQNYGSGLFLDWMLRDGVPKETAQSVFDVMRKAQIEAQTHRDKDRAAIAKQVIEPELMRIDFTNFKKIADLAGIREW